MRALKINQRGVTLVELMVATAVLAATAAVVSVYLPRAAESQLQTKNREQAVVLGSSKLEELKTKHYQLVTLTPAGAYLPANCDCTQADFTNASYPNTEQLETGGIRFTRQVCVNRVSGPGGTPSCPTAADTGYKNMIVNLSWTTGNKTRSVRSESLVQQRIFSAPSSSTGTFQVSVCIANASDPNQCDNTKSALLPGTIIAAYKGSTTIMAGYTIPSVRRTHTIPNGASSPYTYNLAVAPGAGYAFQVQQPGYYPYRLESQDVTSGQTIPATVILRSTTAYGSFVGGEAMVADHPVITRLVSEITYRPNTGSTNVSGSYGCPNPTEIIEIFNPTQTTYTIGCASYNTANCLGIAFQSAAASNACGSQSAWSIGPTSFGDALMASAGVVISNATLAPGKYMLIMGVDNTGTAAPYGGPIPPTYQWGSTPDVRYNIPVTGTGLVSDNANGLVSRHGGAVVLYANGVIADSVRWDGWANPCTTDTNWGNTSAAPGAGAWAGPDYTASVGRALPAGSLQGILCTRAP